MTTELTNEGWVNPDPNKSSGMWTNGANIVDNMDDITVAPNVTANTLGGDDEITGTGTGDDNGVGIFNQGTIATGIGNDTIDALTGGFDGGGTINLGIGSDLIRGFGDQTVNGGAGSDTAELGLVFDENQVSLSNGVGSSSIDITATASGETMSFTDVEHFDFSGQTFSLLQLQMMAS